MNEETQPNSPDSEKGLLCSIILHPSIFDESGGINPKIFYVPAHRLIFAHLLEVYQDTETTDFILVRDSFRLMELAEIGGTVGLSEIYAFVPSHENWRFYLERVLAMYRRRITMRMTEEMHKQCTDTSNDLDVVKLAEDFVHELRGTQISGPESHFDEKIKADYEADVSPVQDPRRLLDISGLQNLDSALGGVSRGDLLVVAAETSRGKTALALQMAAHMALGKQALKVAVFSYEMNPLSLRQRIVSAQAEIRLKAIRAREFTDQEREKYKAFRNSLPRGRSIIIVDSYAMTITDVIAHLRKLKATDDLDAAVIDYLQLVNPANTRDSSREREVAEIARRLKTSAGEINIVMVALSQLNDQGQLRESRAIGQHSDDVLIIKENKDAEDSFEREILLDKMRNGPRGQRIKVDFFGDYVSFANKSN